MWTRVGGRGTWGLIHDVFLVSTCTARSGKNFFDADANQLNFRRCTANGYPSAANRRSQCRRDLGTASCKSLTLVCSFTNVGTMPARFTPTSNASCRPKSALRRHACGVLVMGLLGPCKNNPNASFTSTSAFFCYILTLPVSDHGTPLRSR